MLNDKQIEIADHLLKYLDQKGGKSSLDDYPSEMHQQGFEEFEWSFVKEFLREQVELIYYLGNTDYILALTLAGYKAAKMGIVKYFEMIEEEKQLEKENIINNIEGIRSSKKLSKRAIGVAVFVPLLIGGLNLGIQISLNHSANSDPNGVNNINHTHSNLGSSKSDSAFIEKIKHSLQNDPKFLNDLKVVVNEK